MYCTIKAGPSYEDNGNTWTSPYANKTFPVTVKIGNGYPKDAPEVYFTSNLHHPNIRSDGSVCIETLNLKWSSSYQILDALIALKNLLL